MNWKKQKNNYLIFYKISCRLARLPAFKRYLHLLCISLFTYSCTTVGLYERTAIMPKQQWQSTFHPTFTFTIQDTNSLYHIYITIRHTDMYAYNNIWINVGTASPNDSIKYQALNLILANNTTGWFGTGMDDIFEHRVRITKTPMLLKKGLYTFVLAPLMRVDPLPHILNIGIRLEKVNS